MHLVVTLQVKKRKKKRQQMPQFRGLINLLYLVRKLDLRHHLHL